MQVDLSAQMEEIKRKNSLDMSSLNRAELSIVELLVFATENQCSDLYIKLLDVPYFSKFGNIYEAPCRIITKDSWLSFYDEFITNELNDLYIVNRTLDTSISIIVPSGPNEGKEYFYRVALGFSKDKNTAIFRMIKPELLTFDSINYNEKCVQALRQAYSKKTGICIETGPTGSGKSTTLAACINTFTRENDIMDNKVIITLEDPIENTFRSTDSVLVLQKELGRDFRSFSAGIKSALREHPNIIIVGEMRDKEVICTAIEAGRTGHLVSTTFHAADVGGTISRLLYHLDNDKNLAFDLIVQLNIIISQRMLKRNDRYLVDTQYLLFDKEVTDYLLRIIENPNLNVAVEVSKLISDPKLQEAGLAKDWDYPNEV